MTRAQIISATIDAVAAYVDQVADEIDANHDLVLQVSASVTRANATNIRRAGPVIAVMVEERVEAPAYDIEAEGIGR